MTTIQISAKRFLFASLFSCAVFIVAAQPSDLPSRPKFSDNMKLVNVATVDNVVLRSFSVLKSIDEIAAKVTLIENQLKGGIPDLTLMLTQINDCTAGLTTLGSTSPSLAEDIANLVGNIKDLHIPILRIPLALKNLNEARKAIQYCMVYTKYLVSSAIPDIKQKTKPGDKVAETALN